CSLKKIAFMEKIYQTTVVGESGADQNSALYSFIETTDPSCMRDYVFVQYIRGCVVEYHKRKGETSYTGQYKAYMLRDKYVDFNFKNWIVDTIDDDPMYASTPLSYSPDRHYMHYTAKSVLDLSNKNLD